jgi:hypothetical protein
VLPGGDGPACAGRRRCEDHAAVDAADVSSADFCLQPCRDLPSVHWNTLNGEFSGRSLTVASAASEAKSAARMVRPLRGVRVSR